VPRLQRGDNALSDEGEEALTLYNIFGEFKILIFYRSVVIGADAMCQAIRGKR